MVSGSFAPKPAKASVKSADRPPIHICDMCGKPLLSLSSLISHMVHIHQRDRSTLLKLLCDKSPLRSPLDFPMSRGNVRCPVCLKLFLWQAEMEEHLTIHTINKLFPCVICGQKFKNNVDLERHRITHAYHP